MCGSINLPSTAFTDENDLPGSDNKRCTAYRKGAENIRWTDRMKITLFAMAIFALSAISNLAAAETWTTCTFEDFRKGFSGICIRFVLCGMTAAFDEIGYETPG